MKKLDSDESIFITSELDRPTLTLNTKNTCKSHNLTSVVQMKKNWFANSLTESSQIKLLYLKHTIMLPKYPLSLYISHKVI